jgi:hypothetical protein
VHWADLAVEDYSISSCVMPRDEHVENFLHVVLHGSVKYEVLTRGKTLQLLGSLVRPSSCRGVRSTS